MYQFYTQVLESDSVHNGNHDNTCIDVIYIKTIVYICNAFFTQLGIFYLPPPQPPASFYHSVTSC